MNPDADPRFLRFRVDALDGARDPRLVEVAYSVAGLSAEPDYELAQLGDDVIARRRVQCARLLALVQERVTFVHPCDYARPWPCWYQGFGDCKSSATLLASLALAVGCGVRLVALGWDGDPTHVSVQLRCAPEDAWTWAETTLAAKLGEHPTLALARLRPQGRVDLGAA